MSSLATNAILYMCHYYHEGILQEYEKICKAVENIGDAFLLFHVQDLDPPPQIVSYSPFLYTNDDIARLNYPRHSNQINDGNTHLPLCLFYLDNPGYDFYWRIEYDLRFSGDWKYFFESITQWDEDFLSCRIMSYREEPEWCWWELSHPTQRIEPDQRYASFNPIFRISGPALKKVDELQRDGWRGHQEVLLATLLYHSDFRLRDFGGKGIFVHPGDESRFYINEIEPERCSVRWRPFFNEIPENDGKLYHPVKVE